MQKNNSLGKDFYPKMLIVGGKNILTEELVKRFLKKNYKITIAHNHHSLQRTIAKHMKGVNYLLDSKNFAQKIDINYDYIIFIKSPSDNKFTGKIKKTIRLSKDLRTKALFVFPYTETEKNLNKTEKIAKKIFQENLYAGIVFIGDLVLKDLDTQVLDKLSDEREKIINFLHASKGTNLIFPVYLQDAADHTERMLFSLKAYGKKTAIVSHPVTTEKIDKIISYESPFLATANKESGAFLRHGVDEAVNTKAVSDEDLAYFFKKLLKIENKITPRAAATPTSDVVFHPKPSKPTLEVLDPPKEAVADFSEALIQPEDQNDSRLGDFFLKFKNIKIKRKYKTLLVLPIFLLLLPFLVLLTNAFLMKGTTFVFAEDNPQLRNTLFDAAKVSANINAKYSGVLAAAPVFGSPYSTVKNTSVLLSNLVEIEKTKQDVLQNTSKVIQEFFEDSPSEIHSNVQKITLGLDTLYNDLSFLQGNINDSGKSSSNFIQRVNSYQNLREKRAQINFLKEMAVQVPDILGQVNPKTYLVILQDDEVLRPTGGLIREMALVTISGGRVVEIEIYGQETFNNKIGGETSVPEPFLKYFGQEEWTFENANWNPDFPTTAEKLEWFIDKSLNRSLDGVIAVNMSFVRETSESIKTNEGENLKRLTGINNQAGANKDFVLKEFFHSLAASESKNKLIYALGEGLDSLDVQIFLNNNQAQSALDELGWSGSAQKRVCTENNCYSDFIHLVEVGKEGQKNPELLKELELTVAVEEGVIKRELAVFLENRDENLNKPVHEVYLRVFVPGNSGFSPVEVVTDNDRKQVEPEVYGSRGFKEAGVMTETPQNSVRAYIFSWESPLGLNLDQEGVYYLSWKKQPGSQSYQTSVSFDFPKEVSISTSDKPSLTGEQPLLYNTPLSEDLLFQVFW